MEAFHLTCLDGSPLPHTTSEWLTANEAARYLKVKPRTLLMWARQGVIKGYVLSGTARVTWRFRAADLDATMKPPSVAESGGIQ
jgi:excisionase family DNA binding protein